jgi:hypothetical protein
MCGIVSMEPRLPSRESGESITNPVNHHAHSRMALQMILYKDGEVALVRLAQADGEIGSTSAKI